MKFRKKNFDGVILSKSDESFAESLGLFDNKNEIVIFVMGCKTKKVASHSDNTHDVDAQRAGEFTKRISQVVQT